MKNTFTQGAYASIPIIVAYVPIAVILGATSAEQGFSTPESMGWSLIMFSGANQAVLLSGLETGISLIVLCLICVIASLRHIFYGLALRQKVSTNKKAVLIFAYGLTDEVFAVATATDNDNQTLPDRWLVGLSITALFFWVVATGMGNYLGDALNNTSNELRSAISFALPALFVALSWNAIRGQNYLRIALAGLLSLGFILVGYPNLAIFAAVIASLVPERFLE